jgi:hypothetical protein
MRSKEKNVTSVWRWIWIFFVQAIPCIGFIMSCFWAFSGDNESRKNYFKAHLILLVLMLAVWISLTSLGVLPGLKRQLKLYFADESVAPKHRSRKGSG